MKLSEVTGDRDPGGSTVIVKPQTGEMVRVRRRSFIIEGIDFQEGGRYTFIGHYEDAWVVTTVEAANSGRPTGETESKVRWDEVGWWTVMGSQVDPKSGLYLAWPLGEQLEAC